jgi:hypothetical protein
MKDLPAWVRLAGLVQIGISAANLFGPRRLTASEERFSLRPPMRQVVVVHSTHIVWMVAAVAALWLVFAPEFTTRSALGRGAMALFWGTRLGMERLYYDTGCRRPYRWADGLFSLAFIVLTLFVGRCSWGIL